MSDIKAHSQARFGQFAQGYVSSKTHSQGEDLERLVEMAQPQPDWLALDVATGGGHTALRFAPHVQQVIASDITPKMLTAAQEFITGQGAENISFAAADAENLPFASNRFDLVTCRIAPHHFPDIFRFVLASARVLKPGGLLVVQDHVLPEEKRDAGYIEAFQRLNDPSHHRAYSESEWRRDFLDADLTIEHAEILSKPIKVVQWGERQGNDADTIERLQILLAQAPKAAAEWLQPKCVGTVDATFEQSYILVVGRK